MLKIIDVHTEHCCFNRCKYGNANCTVVTRKAPPSYQCEMCNCDYFDKDQKVLQAAEDWWGDCASDETKRYIYKEYNNLFEY